MSHPEQIVHPPESWRQFRARSKGRWIMPLLGVQWAFDELAWHMTHWSVLKVLSYAETFSILIALIFWVAESHERTQQKHFQAWQVINTAQGKGGSGGRLDALEQLNEDRVPLVGVDASEAFLQNIRLDKAELRRATFRAADLRSARFQHASMEDTNFASANLRGADLRNADVSGATFSDADLTGAKLSRANVNGVVFDKADLRGADLANLQDWRSSDSWRLANIYGVKNPPDGLVRWAAEHGAVQMASTEQWNAAIEAAATSQN